MKNLIPFAIGALVLMKLLKKKTIAPPPRDSDLTLPDDPNQPPRGTPRSNIYTGRVRRR